MKVRVESAPSPGEHKASPLPCYGFASRCVHGPRHRASTRHRPYHATALQAGACMAAKERFFPFTRTFHSMCHSPTETFGGGFGAKQEDFRAVFCNKQGGFIVHTTLLYHFSKLLSWTLYIF